MNVHRSCTAVVLVAPHTRQQHLAREHLAGVLREEFQQFIFHEREVEGSAVETCLICLEVKDKSGVFDKFRSCRSTFSIAGEQVTQARF